MPIDAPVWVFLEGLFKITAEGSRVLCLQGSDGDQHWSMPTCDCGLLELHHAPFCTEALFLVLEAQTCWAAGAWREAAVIRATASLRHNCVEFTVLRAGSCLVDGRRCPSLSCTFIPKLPACLLAHLQLLWWTWPCCKDACQVVRPSVGVE
jgi:hypothetical protein